ncbi:MAG: hypothetical protein R3C43_04290 [Chloroflexota bacterium]
MACSGRLRDADSRNRCATWSSFCSGDCSIQPNACRPATPNHHDNARPTSITDKHPDVHAAAGRRLPGRARRGFPLAHFNRAATDLYPSPTAATCGGGKVVVAAPRPFVWTDLDG